jgi:Zn-dependent M28 family amino/carboxypeptidase
VQASCKERLPLGLLNQTTLIADLATLSSPSMLGRKSGTNEANLAKEFIQARFTTIGLSYFLRHPSFLQDFRYPHPQSKNQGVNVVGWIEGQSVKEKFIVVTAHYDHLGSKGRHVFYGADDNASGVAALLNIAGKAVETGLNHSVIFVATDAEEQGLHGAKAFVRDLAIPKESVLLNINLDMLAEGGRKKRLYTTITRKKEQLIQLVENVAENAALCLVNGHKKSQRFSQFGKKINWRKASDHAAFASADIPYVFLGGAVHKRYHTPKDSFENIDQAFYIAAVETAWLLLQAADSTNLKN